jgi:cytochrome P450 PksS
VAELRDSAPVYLTALPDKSPVWLVSRYVDVVALLKDERFVKNRRTAMTTEQLSKMSWVPSVFRPLERNMLDLDAPDHTRLRALVHKALRRGSLDR